MGLPIRLLTIACVFGLSLSHSTGLAEMIISPSDAGIVYLGRFDHSDPERPVFGWSGTAIRARFRGSSLRARFADHGDNFLYYIIDGGDPVSLELQPAATDYTLATGLPDGLHSVEIGKKTEGTHGEVTFLRFALDAGIDFVNE